MSTPSPAAMKPCSLWTPDEIAANLTRYRNQHAYELFVAGYSIDHIALKIDVGIAYARQILVKTGITGDEIRRREDGLREAKPVNITHLTVASENPEVNLRAAMDDANQRFVARLLREHVRSDTLPGGWSFPQMVAACKAHGVALPAGLVR